MTKCYGLNTQDYFTVNAVFNCMLVKYRAFKHLSTAVTHFVDGFVSLLRGSSRLLNALSGLRDVSWEGLSGCKSIVL